MQIVKEKTTSLKITDLKIFICFPLFFLMLQVPAAGQKIYFVNTISDLKDIDLADEHCADKNGDCSLRAAIENANKSSKKDKIHFAIPGVGPFEIMLRKNLPKITEPIELDATTQPFYSSGEPKVILNGKNIPHYNHPPDASRKPVGFRLMDNSSGSAIKGFVIGGFGYTNNAISRDKRIYQPGIGIDIETGNNIIQSNFIGISANGSSRFSNIFGVVISGSENLIGGDKPEQRNIISANWRSGILSHSNNQIKGNFIGTNSGGTISLSNKFGISLVIHSENNLIEQNLISGNQEGISITGDRNFIYNNKIGTNHKGKEKIPNETGITLMGSREVIISKGNQISGNKVGILIDDYLLKAPQNNHVWGNFIGTDPTGKNSVANGTGIFIRGGNGNLIGGSDPEKRNVISGNTSAGILISQAKGNRIEGNFIGTDITGKKPLPNSLGIEFSGESIKEFSTDNSVYKNLISGNKEDGVKIDFATGNSLLCNLIGTTIDGIIPLPNCGNGIKIAQNSFSNCIGSTDSGNLNIISHNNKNGVLLTAPANYEAEFLKNQVLPNNTFKNNSFNILIIGKNEPDKTKVRE